MEYENLKNELKHLQEREEIFAYALKGIQRKVDELRSKRRSIQREIRECKKEMEHVAEHDVSEWVRTVIDHHGTIDECMLYEIMKAHINKYMNTSDVLTVYDFIAYNILRGKSWKYGLTPNKHGQYLNNEPDITTLGRVNNAIFTVIVSWYFERYRPDHITKICFNRKIRDYHEDMIKKITKQITTPIQRR